jgi:hypothetical protein
MRNVADHPALAGLAGLASKSACGETMTIPVTVVFGRRADGKWERPDPEFGANVAPESEVEYGHQVGDVAERRYGSVYEMRIAVPRPHGGKRQAVRDAVKAARPALLALAEELFLAANPGAELVDRAGGF